MSDSLKASTPVRQFLKDYQAPLFQIHSTHLTFDIHEDHTTVTNEMSLSRQKKDSINSSPTSTSHLEPLILTGPQSGCAGLWIRPSRPSGPSDNPAEYTPVPTHQYTVEKETLTLKTELQDFELKIITQLKPQENTELLGLYQTGTGLCTQCEPEGFRNITFFLDRPDVMTRYKTTIIADKKKFPILLSNGNRIKQEIIENGRHQVVWEDPFPKPSYLFALVAGNYGVIKDQFVTMSGRTVDLEIYSEHGNEFQCHHAMAALKRSMKWDEDVYQREYDLNQFLILAVDDFNGGAMENKGLNIFNSRMIFADNTTATDDEFTHVEAVIAHEYFHNWTGNRITLRDWFQLSLKEGLTVFREQHYMSDLTSASVKRIDEVEFLRAKQFPEDAGPNAHPVRPESCLSVDNFYTTTVYEKGAEVIRVLKHLIGPEQFKKGMDYYFNTYDGKAITIEDFLKAFEHTTGKDLSQFKRWYSTAGTPKVSIKESYDNTKKTYQLTFHQETEVPFVIPMKMSLFSPTTKKSIPLKANVSNNAALNEITLELNEKTTTWTLENCQERPVPSLFRTMTAPVNLNWSMPSEQLEFLAVNDTDGFNQWESLQKLSLSEIINCYQSLENKREFSLNNNYVTLYKKILTSSLENPILSSRLLQLPSYEYAVQNLPLGFNPVLLADAFDQIQSTLSATLHEDLWQIEKKVTELDQPSQYDFKSMGFRKLRNTVWSLLGARAINIPQLSSKFSFQKTMNDQSGILSALNAIPSNERTQLMKQFSEHWSSSALIINKWLSWEATLNHSQTLQRVQDLSQSEFFKATNPNKVRSLYGSFTRYCPRAFHRDDGAGYQFMAEKILEVDAVNPATAARLSQGLEDWYRLEPKRKSLIHSALESLVQNPKLSKNSYEILKRSLDFKI